MPCIFWLESYQYCSSACNPAFPFILHVAFDLQLFVQWPFTVMTVLNEGTSASAWSYLDVTWAKFRSFTICPPLLQGCCNTLPLVHLPHSTPLPWICFLPLWVLHLLPTPPLWLSPITFSIDLLQEAADIHPSAFLDNMEAMWCHPGSGCHFGSSHNSLNGTWSGEDPGQALFKLERCCSMGLGPL